MSFMRRIFVWKSWKGRSAKQDWESSLDDELRFHLEQHTAQNIAGGMPPGEARRQAILRLGGIEALKEECRDQRRGIWLETLWNDVRYGLRVLLKNPGFAAIAIVTLALGIGANTAIFSVVNSVLLRQPPYQDPSRLVWIADFLPSTSQTIVLDADYMAWRRQNHAFADVAAFRPGPDRTLTGAGEPERLSGARATTSFLDVLGVQPRLGRNFSADEDRHGGPPVVLLSDSLWRRRFSANANMIGRMISLDGTGYTVVGILPPQFEFLENAHPDVIVPFALSDAGLGVRRPVAFVDVVARLRPGVSIAGATDDLNGINQRLQSGYTGGWVKMMQGQRVQVESLHDRSVGDVRTALLLMLGAVGFVLLIACANVANLQLARAVSRETEMAIRSALGAGRWRMARQLLTESGIVALCGGTAGAFLAWSLLDLMRNLGPKDIPHLAASSIDARILLFTLALSLLTGILSGLAPIRLVSRIPLNDSLKEGNARTGAGVSARRSQQLLSIAEIALALVLFVGSGLLIRSFVRLISLPPGFSGRNVVTAQIALPITSYRSPDQQRAFFSQLVERMKSLPGVASAGATATLPLQGFELSEGVQVEGRPQEPMGPSSPSANVDMISPGYFTTLRIPLVAGRLLDSRDAQGQPNALVVNQAFVRRFFPDENPLGKRLQLEGEQWWMIVGVVADYKQTRLAAEMQPEVFATIEQWPSGRMALVIRTAGDPLRIVPAVRAQASAIDPNFPLYNVATMDDMLSREVASQRFDTALLAVFAGLALLLAAIGIFGVMAYAVSQRTHEIGVRIALGAQWSDVGQLVLGQGMWLASIGVFVGLIASFGLTRLMSSLLFDVKPTDPLTFGSAALLLFAVMVTACYIPARRAMRVDPMVALRYE
jgi:putative ABC transport system permease protein